MPKLLLPIAAVLAVGAATAGGATYVLTRGDTMEEVPPPAVQATTTPSPAASETPAAPTPTPPAKPEATPTPDPTADWKTYTDAELGFKLPHPEGLVVSEQLYELPEKNDIPATTQRHVRFLRDDGVPVVGISVTPNPADLTLQEWIRTVPGWPCDPEGHPTCEPSKVLVDGEIGIEFSINVLGDQAATVHFAHSGAIYALGGNVYGSADGGFPAALSEADSQRVIEEFRFGD